MRGTTAIAEPLQRLLPDAVVLAGGYASDDEVARWAYAVRAAAGPLPVALYRRGSKSTRLRTTLNGALPDSPLAAARQVLELAEVPAVEQITPVEPDGERPIEKAFRG